jgi:hypothetical protein
MIIILYGLPGSGRKTLVEELKKNYNNIVFFDDFSESSLDEIKNNLKDNTNITICTMFVPSLNELFGDINIKKNKFAIIFLKKVFKQTIDHKYSEFFGIDIKFIYETDIFKEMVTEDTRVGNYLILNYDYNFDNLKTKIDNLINTDSLIVDDIKKIIDSQVSTSSTGISKSKIIDAFDTMDIN